MQVNMEGVAVGIVALVRRSFLHPFMNSITVLTATKGKYGFSNTFVPLWRDGKVFKGVWI